MREMMAGFIIGIIFTIPFSYLLHRMIMREKVPDMVKEETEKRIKDQDFNISLLQKKLRIAHTERDMAISHAKNALTARNTFADEIRIKLKGL